MSFTRISASVPVGENAVQLQWWLQLTRQESHVVALNSNHRAEEFDWLLGVGCAGEIVLEETSGSFEKLKIAIDECPDWWLGYLTYDLKNDVEKLDSRLPEIIHFPALHFFRPKWLLICKNQEVKCLVLPEFLQEYRQWMNGENNFPENQRSVVPEAGISRENYLHRVEKLQEHIHRGDIYEINYCQYFSVKPAKFDPVALYGDLNKRTLAPFSAFVSMKDKMALCASPERFLKKKGKKITSQPIKGTARRDPDPETDKKIMENLQNDPKEQSENVMIVDLVRNDLSRVAAKGTVKVEELFGLQTFPTVHQLVSTISAELKENVHPVVAIKNAFPMGSMTGAPKIRAMELTEQYETHKRGLFSGAIGYFTPGMDFDLNVVIRTIFYDAKKKEAGFAVGGAITALAEKEKEYDECMLKADALINSLLHKGN